MKIFFLLLYFLCAGITFLFLESQEQDKAFLLQIILTFSSIFMGFLLNFLRIISSSDLVKDKPKDVKRAIYKEIEKRCDYITFQFVFYWLTLLACLLHFLFGISFSFSVSSFVGSFINSLYIPFYIVKDNKDRIRESIEKESDKTASNTTPP